MSTCISLSLMNSVVSSPIERLGIGAGRGVHSTRPSLLQVERRFSLEFIVWVLIVWKGLVGFGFALLQIGEVEVFENVLRRRVVEVICKGLSLVVIIDGIKKFHLNVSSVPLVLLIERVQKANVVIVSSQVGLF